MNPNTTPIPTPVRATVIFCHSIYAYQGYIDLVVPGRLICSHFPLLGRSLEWTLSRGVCLRYGTDFVARKKAQDYLCRCLDVLMYVPINLLISAM